MKNIIIVAAAVVAISQLTGCASLTSDSTSQVTVRTTNNGVEVSGARCTLSNNKGEAVISNTPQTVGVQKSFGDMQVQCRKGNASGSKIVASSTNINNIGNIIIGGGIGFLIDAGTGKGYNYPDNVTIDLNGMNHEGGLSQ